MTNRSSPSSTRYNPFAFPSDVDSAFGLLVSVILGVSLTLYVAIANAVGSGLSSAPEGTLNARCASLAGPLSQSDSALYQQQWLTAFSACLNAKTTPIHLVVSGLAALAIVAAAIYLLYPAWKVKRGHLVPLTAHDSPEVVEELRALCRLAGLAHVPRFVWNPLDMTPGGLAFGLPGRRYVALTGGLVTKLWTDPDVFRVVVLHELAHLRHADVDKAYLTVAVWWSFVVSALLPFAVFTAFLFHSPPLVMARRALGLAALALVVYLVRNTALRAREVYADVRASTWPPGADAVRRTLRATSAPDRARQWLSVHPSTSARTDAVRDTGPLFATGFWFAAGTGIAGSLAMIGVQAFGNSIPNVPRWVGDWAGPAVFAGLIVGVAGVTTWRAAFLADARGEPLRGTWRVAVGVAVGVGAGALLSLAETVVLPAGFELMGVPLAVFEVWWYGLLFAGSMAFFGWAAAGASAWLPVTATSGSPRRALVVGLLPAVLVLATGLWFLFFIRADLFVGGMPPAPAPSDLHVDVLANERIDAAFLQDLSTHSPFLYVAVQLLWAVPLAAWLFRRRTAPVSTARWAPLDHDSAVPGGSAPPQLRPGLAVLTGLVGGLVLGVVAYRATGQLLAGLLVQAAVACLLAVRLRRLGVVHGLLAASACGVVMVLAALAENALTHSQVDVLQAASTYLNASTLLTVPAAAGAAAVASWARRSASPATHERTEVRPGVPVVAVVGASLLVLIAAQVALNQTTPSIGSASPSAASGVVVFDDAFTSDKGWTQFRSGSFLTDLRPRALHASVQVPNTLQGEFAPGTGRYARIRIDATMAQTGGDGLIGIACRSTEAGTYYFLISSSGGALIARGADDRGRTAILTKAAIPGWDPSRRHRLTAICSGPPTNMNLDFLLDGGGILRASDDRHIGSFSPAFLLLSGATTLDVDIVHFTVATLE